jgi:hypothetical protein
MKKGRQHIHDVLTFNLHIKQQRLAQCDGLWLDDKDPCPCPAKAAVKGQVSRFARDPEWQGKEREAMGPIDAS